MADLIRAKYKGQDKGEGLPFLPGIPARDLHDTDFDALDADEKTLVRQSNLYDYVPYTEKPKDSAPAKKDGEGK